MAQEANNLISFAIIQLIKPSVSKNVSKPFCVVKHAVKKMFSSIKGSIWADQLRPRTESDRLERKIL